MRILFIGGTGTISTAITKQLAKTDNELYLINRGTRNAELPDNIKFITVDINDEAAVAEKGYEVETHLEGGHPGDVIVNLAEKLDCDLIIAGSLGKSAFDRLFLGSVSSYISKATKTNFLIVRN